jgi:GrpB-like predicted nucleotidyltransferase (UPF0157 family)
MISPHDDPIELVESRHEAWRAAFERERERVQSVLDRHGLGTERHRIEHVGSTAVPGLAAKDIVDLDIVVADDSVGIVSRVLADKLGGTRYENSDSWHPVFRAQDGQRFNDHVFARSDDGWKVSVATAVALRERPELRTEYEQHKRATAEETDNLGRYSRAKSEVLGRLLAAARDLDRSFAFEVPREP